MENQFVTYEQSLALKELGFDEPCIATYTDGAIGKNDRLQWFVTPIKEVNKDFTFVAAPLKSQVFRWFREEHHMFSHIMTYEGNEIPRFKGEFAYFAEIDFLIASEEIEKPFKTYEDAESACIDRLIEIVKNR